MNLEFSQDYSSLKITDNGIGMNPLEFIHQYIRIGKSNLKKAEHTPKFSRPRIGGKGIGFLAPARYCRALEIRTKKGDVSVNYFTINKNEDDQVDIKHLFTNGHKDEGILNFIKIIKITDRNDIEIKVKKIDDFIIYFEKPVSDFNIWYEFDSRSIELFSTIDF